MSEVKKKILLADDDPDQIFQVSHHVKIWGYDTFRKAMCLSLARNFAVSKYV